MPFEGQVIIVEGKDGEYLVSSQQGSASVHVILRLKDVDHLVRVEFEHALHFLLFQGFLASLTGLLVQLLSAFLVLPDPSQIPVYKSKDEHDEREQGHVESDSLLNNIDIKGTVPINVTLFILSKRKWITITIKKQIWQLTWEEKRASGRDVPSAQVWWNLGLSSVRHNQTNAVNTENKNKSKMYALCVWKVSPDFGVFMIF